MVRIVICSGRTVPRLYRPASGVLRHVFLFSLDEKKAHGKNCGWSKPISTLEKLRSRRAILAMICGAVTLVSFC